MTKSLAAGLLVLAVAGCASAPGQDARGEVRDVVDTVAAAIFGGAPVRAGPGDDLEQACAIEAGDPGARQWTAAAEADVADSGAALDAGAQALRARGLEVAARADRVDATGPDGARYVVRSPRVGVVVVQGTTACLRADGTAVAAGAVPAGSPAAGGTSTTRAFLEQTVAAVAAGRPVDWRGDETALSATIDAGRADEAAAMLAAVTAAWRSAGELEEVPGGARLTTSAGTTYTAVVVDALGALRLSGE